MKKRGQVSSELIAALGVLLVLFILVLGYYYERMSDVRETSEMLEKRHDCMMLSAAIAGSYTNPGSSLNMTLLHDANVRGGLQLIKMDGYRCRLAVGNVADADLAKGDIIISNNNKTVVAENVQIPE